MTITELFTVISKNRLVSNQRRATGSIIHRVRLDATAGKLQDRNYVFLINQIESQLIGQKSQTARVAGAFLLYQLIELYNTVLYRSPKLELNKSMCRMRGLLIKMKHDANRETRLYVVLAISQFPEPKSKSYVVIRSLRNDRDSQIRKIVSEVEAQLNKPSNIEKKYKLLACP